MYSKSKLAAFGLTASALLFTACGDKSGGSAVKAVTIPDAPDAAIQSIAHELAKANGSILWQAMPAGYQADLNTLVQLAGTKIDAEIYDKSFALIGRLSQVAQKQRAFIFNTKLSERSAEEQAKWEQGLPLMVGFIDTIITSDLATSLGLKSFEGEKFFDTTVSKLLEYGSKLSELSEETGLADLANAVVTVVDASDTEATLSISVADQPAQEEAFTKVEGRWVPTEMSSTWVNGIADATAKLQAITLEQLAAQKPQLLSVLTMVEGVLANIDVAETQEQFDQALQGAVMPLMGLMMMGQGMGGSMSAPMPSAPVAPMPVAPSGPVAP